MLSRLPVIDDVMEIAGIVLGAALTLGLKWLGDASDQTVITPGRIVVLGDDEALAMGRIVDLVEHENGTIVHIEVLPGIVDAYLDAAARATGAAAH